MKVFLIVLAIVIGLVLLGIAIKFIFFPVNTIQKSMDMAYDVVDDTLSAENAIYNYEYFKKQIESIKALESKLTRAEEATADFKATYPDSSDWGKSEKDEYARLSANEVALGNMLDDAMADYNAKSNMVNRAIFKDNLPTSVTRAIVQGFELTGGY